MGRIKMSDRLALNKKQEKISIGKGVPKLKDLPEGVPIIRMTNQGLIQYIKYKGFLYKNPYIREDDKEGLTITS